MLQYGSCGGLQVRKWCVRRFLVKECEASKAGISGAGELKAVGKAVGLPAAQTASRRSEEGQAD